MGRPKKNSEPDAEMGEGSIEGEYKRPNAARGAEIYDEYISPIKAVIAQKKGDLKEPWQLFKKESNVSRKEFDYVLTLIEEDDDAKREHRLRSLRELLIHYDLTIAPDLVDQANGHNSANIVQFGQRRETGLEGLTGDDDFEASPEELAQQEGRSA